MIYPIFLSKGNVWHQLHGSYLATFLLFTAALESKLANKMNERFLPLCVNSCFGCHIDLVGNWCVEINVNRIGLDSNDH